jgi:hypothetical protein
MSANICPFREYSNIFGAVNTGAHQYRIGDVAIVDYILTIIGAFVLSYMTKIPVVLTTIGLLVGSIIIHLLFGVETNTLKYLGITCQ